MTLLRFTMRNLAVSVPGLAVAGCASGAQAPSVPIFGSYFPAWIICTALGVLFAVALRIILVKTGINEELPMPPLVYLSATVLGGVVCWLVWTGAFA